MYHASLIQRHAALGALGDDGDLSFTDTFDSVPTPSFTIQNDDGSIENVPAYTPPAITDTQTAANYYTPAPSVGPDGSNITPTSSSSGVDTSTMTAAAKGIGAGLAAVLVKATGGQVLYNAQGQPIGFQNAQGVQSQLANLLTGSSGNLIIYGAIALIAFKLLGSNK